MLLTPSQAAKLLGVSLKVLRGLAAAGKIPVVRLSTRSLRYPLSGLPLDPAIKEDLMASAKANAESTCVAEMLK